MFTLWNNTRGEYAYFVEAKSGMTGIGTAWPTARLEVNGSFRADRAGIGCSPPAANSNWKLFVEGGIKARELKVTVQNFADYVFEPSCCLRSLNELEAFIRSEKHLPGIPTAAEIEQNDGMEVGKMQTLLLEKVEEQALYIIQLQKQMDELRSQVQTLKEGAK